MLSCPKQLKSQVLYSSCRKVSMSNNRSFDPLCLRSSNSRAFLLLAFAFLSFFTGVALLLFGIWPAWILCALAIPPVLLYRYNPPSTLMISFGGISVDQFGHTSSFKWNDIEEFSVRKTGSRKLVVICLSRAAIRRGIEKGIYLTRLTDQQGGHRYIIPDNFGYSPEKLRDVLKHWRSRVFVQ